MKFIEASRRTIGAVALAAAALVAGCGGGDLLEPFQPDRILAFGDETSVIEANGRNWGVNGLDSSGAFSCTLKPNWVQALATGFGFAFPQCNPAGFTRLATMYAVAGAKQAGVAAQIDAHLAGGTGFNAKDLVTILAGQHDILEVYAQVGTLGVDAAKTELRNRGKALAAQVNRVAQAGGKVLIVTVPDLGLSPFALAEQATTPGRQQVLKDLTEAFNNGLRADIINDGRRIGLVLADEMVQVVNRAPAFNGFTNVTQAVCSTAPPGCTTGTLVTGGSDSTWLWADTTHLSYGGHNRLTTLADTRARNNPF